MDGNVVKFNDPTFHTSCHSSFREGNRQETRKSKASHTGLHYKSQRNIYQGDMPPTSSGGAVFGHVWFL